MLLEFRVKNFRSFGEEQTFSLVASSDLDHEDTAVSNVGGHRVLKSAAIYGANASGKSNLFKAFEFVSNYMSSSATRMNIDDEIDVDPFLLDERLKDEPTEFFFAILLGDIRYDYAFAVTRNRVVEERIVAYPRGRAQQWLTRTFNRDQETYEWSFRGPLAKEAKGLKARTRDNGLVLARGAERNIEELKPLYLWLAKKLRTLDLSFPPTTPQSTMSYSINLFQNQDEFRDFLEDLVRAADVGITQVGVEERFLSIEDFPQKMHSKISKDFIDKLSNQQAITWLSKHSNLETGYSSVFHADMESEGTLRLMAFSGPLWDTLQNGYCLVVDEFHSSLHPHLARKLIQLFLSPEHNKSGAQLIFVTHDSTLMDLSLLRRDQIWLTEKNQTGASELYSLWDFKDKPRKQEAIQRGYLGGRYGGVPNFGSMLEAVE